eukprot:jgi/Botrbrau1/16556/Bobra.176_2s0005.1
MNRSSRQEDMNKCLHGLHHVSKSMDLALLIGWTSAKTNSCVQVYVLGWSPFSRWKLRHIPGFRGIWLLGNIPEMVRLGPHAFYPEAHKKFGPVFKIWYGTRPIVVIGDGPSGRAIARRGRRRSKLLPPAVFMGKEHMRIHDAEIFSLQEENYHRSLKSVWPGAFRREKMDEYLNQMKTSIESGAASLREAALQGAEVNMLDFYGDLAMDIIGSTAFGIDLDVFQNKRSKGETESTLARKVVEAVKYHFDHTGPRGTIYIALAMMWPSAVSVTFWQALASLFPDRLLVKNQEVRSFMLGLLVPLMRDAQVSAGRPTVPGPFDEAAKAHQMDAIRIPGGGFMAHLMKEQRRDVKQPLTDAEILAQALTFLEAGYETTASHITFTTYLLLKHPEKLAKLRKELDNISEHVLHQVDAEAVPYLAAVQQESLRLYPVGNLLLREAPCDLNVCGYRIPKGTAMHINLHAIGRSSEHWNQPDEFLPERWIPGDPLAASTPDDCLYGFGDGSLQCAGMRFAKHEASLVLGHMFRKFDFILSPGHGDLALTSQFAFKPLKGVFVIPKIRTA